VAANGFGFCARFEIKGDSIENILLKCRFLLKVAKVSKVD
jgi:hypothetical protein